MKHLTIGIAAHVDAGKTTLSEALLYQNTDRRTLGRVDHKDAFLDTTSMEKERGITIFSHQAQIETPTGCYTLLDTPGHVDFSAETERTLSVLDYVILVISGSEGVQSHTETLWRLLERYHVPTFIFVNKMDLNGADKKTVLKELKNRLSFGSTDFSEENQENLQEEIALLHENWMEEFLETGTLSDKILQQGIQHRIIVPCVFGSALKLQGTAELWQIIERYTKEPHRATDFGAMVYKISKDEKGVRQTHIKITGGVLHVREPISYTDETHTELQEKVGQIRIYNGLKFKEVQDIQSGQVCAVTGLSRTYIGQGLGFEPDAPLPILEAVMSYGILLPDTVNPVDAYKTLHTLEEEDPALHISWNAQSQELRVHLMGAVQVEIFQHLAEKRCGYPITLTPGQINYRETIANTVEGVGHYEPLCHYAEVHLLLEPLPQGSGLKFATDCREDKLDKNWQRLILTHLNEKTHVGVLTGSPITDMKITLCAGKAHLKHTEGGDFRQATYRAIRNGLRKAESVLLEPWYHFTIELPTEYVGRAITDIQQMNGKLDMPLSNGTTTVLTGSAPVANLQEYPVELISYTKGFGKIHYQLQGYAPCPHAEEICQTIGYSCDNDVENTADSVFCSHGSGFVVKWDQVTEYMHLPSVLETKKQQEQESLQAQNFSNRSIYHGSIEEDKELQKIFEQTYGKIQRDPRALFHKEEYTPIYTQKSTPIKTGPEYLLVDGYNIIFAWEELKKLSLESLELARTRLIQILSNYRGYKQCKLILVFDAYKVKGQHRKVEEYCGIQIVYTQEAETADTYIEKASHDLAKNHRVRVATSDGWEQMIILGNGALRISAAEFEQEVKEVYANIEKIISAQKQGSNKLEF